MGGREAGADDKDKGNYRAERAGWFLGMFVGEGKGSPYPFVTELDPESEAKKLGIRAGDELIRVDGADTQPFAPVYERVSRYRPGRYVTVWVRRGSQTLRFQVRVPRSPTAAPAKKAETARDGKDGADGDGTSADGKQKKKKKKVVIKPVPLDPP